MSIAGLYGPSPARIVYIARPVLSNTLCMPVCMYVYLIYVGFSKGGKCELPVVWAAGYGANQSVLLYITRLLFQPV